MMNTTLKDLKEAVLLAIKEHGPKIEVALYNASGDQHTNPIKFSWSVKDDGSLEIE